MNRIFSPCAFALAIVMAPAVSMAEDLTQSQMTDAFNKQATRGLSLVPAPETQPASTGTTGTQIAAAPPPVEPIYTPVEEEVAPTVEIRIVFDLNSAALRADQHSKLETLCQAMSAANVDVFQIIGHTDSSGSAAYNETLSLERAKEVKRYMVNDCGIAETRLNAIGVGEEYPTNTQNTRAPENRRVEVQALS